MYKLSTKSSYKVLFLLIAVILLSASCGKEDESTAASASNVVEDTTPEETCAVAAEESKESYIETAESTSIHPSTEGSVVSSLKDEDSTETKASSDTTAEVPAVVTTASPLTDTLADVFEEGSSTADSSGAVEATVEPTTAVSAETEAPSTEAEAFTIFSGEPIVLPTLVY